MKTIRVPKLKRPLGWWLYYFLFEINWWFFTECRLRGFDSIGSYFDAATNRYLNIMLGKYNINLYGERLVKDNGEIIKWRL